MERRRFLLLAGTALVSSCTSLGQGTRPGDALISLYANPAKDQWPEEFHQLPATTQAMYRYAATNHDVLQYIPCFCGCVDGGHTSNFDCYVRQVYPDGGIRLDTMSFN